MSIDYSGLSRLLSVSRDRNISDSNGEIDSINLVRQKCVSNSRDTSDSNGGQVSKLSDSNGEINIPIVSQSEVSTSNSVALKALNIELIDSSDCKETKSQTHPLDGCSSCDVIRETKSIKSPSNGTSEVDLSDRNVKYLCEEVNKDKIVTSPASYEIKDDKIKSIKEVKNCVSNSEIKITYTRTAPPKATGKVESKEGLETTKLDHELDDKDDVVEGGEVEEIDPFTSKDCQITLLDEARGTEQSESSKHIEVKIDNKIEIVESCVKTVDTELKIGQMALSSNFSDSDGKIGPPCPNIQVNRVGNRAASNESRGYSQNNLQKPEKLPVDNIDEPHLTRTRKTGLRAADRCKIIDNGTEYNGPDLNTMKCEFENMKSENENVELMMKNDYDEIKMNG